MISARVMKALFKMAGRNQLEATAEFKMQQALAKVVEALEAQKLGPNCFCDVAIGDPRMTSHSSSCVMASDALLELELALKECG